MSSDKTGLLVNLFDKETLYSISKEDVAPSSIPIKEIQVEEQKISLSPVAEKTFVSEGANRKGIIILFEDKTNAFLNAKDKEVLNKIFGALQLDFLNDSLLINLSENKSFKRDNLKEHKAKLVISFGINLFKFGFEEVEFLQYEMKELDELIVLPSESIDKMTAKVDAKKAFWLAIQRAVSNL